MSNKENRPSGFLDFFSSLFSRSSKKYPSSTDAVRYHPDPDMGLIAEQVEERTEQGYNSRTGVNLA